MKTLNLLFIGNSHTYYNDMPLMVQCRAEEAGCSCRVTMIAHGGWFLAQHAEEPDVRFNILYGKYDYVILQEHAHPFGPEEDFRVAAVKLNVLIRQAGSKPILYETWAKKDEPHLQPHMNEVHEIVAADINALLAPVGEGWWGYIACLVDPEIGEAGDVDTCTIMLRFENGALGVIDNSRQAVYGYDQRIEVFGSKGCVTADNETANNTTLYTADTVTREKPLWFFLERYNDAYIAEAQSFVDACLNDRETLVGVNDGLQPVLIGLAAKESCTRGGTPVKVLKERRHD